MAYCRLFLTNIASVMWLTLRYNMKYDLNASDFLIKNLKNRKKGGEKMQRKRREA